MQTNILIGNLEVRVTGKFIRIAKLRHEWCDFLTDPPTSIKKYEQEQRGADLFTFIHEIYDTQPGYPFRKETARLSVLPITGYNDWLQTRDFKVRNKIRKAQKSGVELRLAQLDDDFARGVETIYNESPIRQGRRFWHYGKTAAVIKEELSSFLDRSYLVGAYFQGRMIGFMKLFHGNNVLRTVHIIAKLTERDKPVQDALIAKAVQMCDERKVPYLQYGSWATGGLGAFRLKHGFRPVDVTRYFVPLTLRGKLVLHLGLHRPIRERVPEEWVERMLALRARWNSFRNEVGSQTTSSLET